MHYTYVLRSEPDGLLYTGSASDLRARLSQYRSGYVRSTARRRPLALIYWSGPRIAVTSASECVRRGSQAWLFTPVILSAGAEALSLPKGKDQRGEAEAASLSRGILRQHHSSNRSSPYATSVAALRPHACSALRVNSDSSAALGMMGKSSRQLERHSSWVLRY
jgi:hypothetical protein